MKFQIKVNPAVDLLVECVGFIVDKTLDLEDNINNFLTKANSGLAVVRWPKQLLPGKVLLCFYRTLIESRFPYGNIVWGNVIY